MTSTLCCEVGLNTVYCEFPAALVESEEPVRTRCFACGQRACKLCTKITGWYRHREVRVCNDCVGDYQ